MSKSFPVTGTSLVENLIGNLCAIEITHRWGRHCRKVKVVQRRQSEIFKITYRDFDGSLFRLDVDIKSNRAQIASPCGFEGSEFESLLVAHVWNSICQTIRSKYLTEAEV